MIRVVLNTNVVVSAYLNQDGQPFRVLKLALAGLVRLCASEPILAEYEELLQRKRFALDARRTALLMKKIRTASLIVKPAGTLTVCPAPDDNIFLECAQAVKAHYLITGNSKHFPSRWKYTQRITPAAFLANWQIEHSRSTLP